MNSRFKFPRRVRIHGGECGAVARALHHEAQKDALMSYERAFLCLADLEKASKSTIERKQMSTKTTLKRIALVAVSALGLSFLAVTPSSAAPSAVYTTAYDTTNGRAIVGAQAVVTFTLDTSTTNTFSWSGVGVVLQADDAGSNADFEDYSGTESSNKINRPTSGTLVATVSSSGTGTVAFTLTSSTAGTQTITVSPVTSGVPGTAVSKTLTWVATTDVDVSLDKSTITTVSTASACKDSSSAANDATLAAAYARSTISYRDTSGNRGLHLCVIVRDNLGNIVDNDNLDSVIVSSSNMSFASGSVDRYAIASDFTDSDSSESGANDGAITLKLYGDGLAQGAGTLTVSITEGSVTITKVLNVTQYGKITAVSFTQSNYALAADADGADYTSSSDKNGTAVVALIKCTDSAGTTVPYCDYDGDGSSDDTGNMYLVVDNDLTPGAPAWDATSPASASDKFANTFGINQGLSAVTASSTYGVQIYIDNDLADIVDNQKSVITFYMKAAAVTDTPATISTGAITFYTSSATADTVSLTVTPESVAVGGTADVQVSVKDADGYPVADGTSVTVNATNGSVISGGSSVTTNGALATAKSFIAGDQASTSVVVASVGKKSASKTVTITGSSAASTNSAIDSAADAAAEAIDAANAATDAANLAAEAADAATVAAEEARDAADAATAAVEELATQVATLMAALKAQITTLANTVAKIAKKVKA